MQDSWFYNDYIINMKIYLHLEQQIFLHSMHLFLLFCKTAQKSNKIISIINFLTTIIERLTKLSMHITNILSFDHTYSSNPDLFETVKIC